MKKIFPLAMAALMAVGGFSSCNNDDDFLSDGMTDAMGRQTIAFDVPFVSKSTRAIVDNTTITDQSLKVFGERSDMGQNAWNTVFGGTELSYVAGKWTPSTPAFWYEYQDYRFVAVCPYSAPFSYNQENGFISLADVPAVQEADSATDYMVSNQFTTTTNSNDRVAVGLTMTHMMSKLCLGIQKTGDYTIRLNSSKVWLPNENLTASYEADSVNIPREDAHCWTWSEFSNTAPQPSADFMQYECFADSINLGTDATGGKIYLIAPLTKLFMFIDLDFDVIDADGKILRNKKISKLPIKRANYAMLSNTSYGITINIHADQYVDNIEFNEVKVLDWDAYDTTIDYNNYLVRFTSNGPVHFMADKKYVTTSSDATSFCMDAKPSSFGVYGVENGNYLSNTNLTTIDFTDMDLSGVTKWSDMFWNCTALTKISNLTKWDKGQITSVEYMFGNCPYLVSIDDLSNLDVSKCTSLRLMFFKCQRLENIGDLRNWDTSNVTNLSGMFNHCNSIKELDLSGWNTSKVTTMAYMFDMMDGADRPIHNTWSKLERVDMSGWDTRNIMDYSWCFQDCDMLKELVLDGWCFPEEVVNTTNEDGSSRFSGMFCRVPGNITVYARGCDDLTVSVLRSQLPSTATIITE